MLYTAESVTEGHPDKIKIPKFHFGILIFVFYVIGWG